MLPVPASLLGAIAPADLATELARQLAKRRGAHGPLDRLDAIWMDDELVWEGPLARSGDFVDITIETRGNVRLYWGTETQDQDPLLATSGTVHAAYRGQAYLVFDQLFFGRDRTNAPNIEVLVARWPNAPRLASKTS